MAYSPSTQTAWESVFYIQYEMTGGWLLRGLHHYMAHAMVVLLAIHFAQVVWDGAYSAPRELNFVIGVALMLVVFGLSLTGYLLPWDQKGYLGHERRHQSGQPGTSGWSRSQKTGHRRSRLRTSHAHSISGISTPECCRDF